MHKFSVTSKSLFIFLLISGIIYYAARYNQVPLVGFFVCMCVLFYSTKFSLTKSARMILFVLSTVVLFGVSMFNCRLASFDGLNLHMRTVLLLLDHGKIFFLETPLKPYLIELFWSLILRYGGHYLLNLSLLGISYGVLYVCWNFYKKLHTSTSVRNWSLFLLFTSPMVLAFALLEFKVDLFMLILILLSNTIFLSYLDKDNVFKAFGLGIILGACFLAKTTLLPNVLILIVFIFIEGGIFKRKFIKALAHTALCVFGVLIPILLWANIYGFSVPRYLSSTNTTNFPSVSLHRDKSLYDACFDIRVNKDYGQFIYGEGLIGILTQPLMYLTQYKAMYIDYGIGNPGYIQYLSIFLFIALPLFPKFHTLSRGFKYFYIYSVLNYLIFIFLVQKVYWYLLQVLPFFCLAVPLYLEFISDKFSNAKPQQDFYKKGVYVLIVLSGCVNLALGLILMLYQTIKESTFSPRVVEIRNASGFLENITDGKLILDANEHPATTLLTFMPDYDTRVLKSDFYFVSSRKTLPEIYSDLKSKNIGYITVKRDSLKKPSYEGCTRENYQILSDFLDKYTYPIYPLSAKDPYIFQIR